MNNVKLVDVHCHLIHKEFEKDLPQVIQRAKDAGVKAILVSGVNPPTNREVLELVKTDPVLKASLGIYPIDALGLVPESEAIGLTHHPGIIDLEEEFAFLKQHRELISAIGEVGLDYKYGKEHKEPQQKNFQRIISFVEKLKKPIIVHTRNAELDCIELLESSSLKKINLHSFGGKRSLVKRAADNGWSFSIPPVCVRLKHYDMVLEEVPTSQLLTETDAPYLSPQAETRNEPANILFSIKKIAEIKKMTPEETANQVFMNYQRMFQ